MQVNLHNITANQFTKYSIDSVTINQNSYTNSIIVTNNEIIDCSIHDINNCSDEVIMQIINLKPDLVIFSVKEIIPHPNLNILKPLYERQIGVEVMHTPALCRTFNFLVSEDRKIAAVIIF